MEVGEESVELGLRTMGLGRTVGQLRLTAAPQRDGFADTDDGSIVLKKTPAGSSPCSWLCETLNDWRFTRFASCFGRAPVRLLNEKSTV